MSRVRPFIESLLIFAVFALQGAWPVPEVNEPYYLGKAIHYWNPHWASGDWFLQTADTHSVFYFTFGWLALWLPPTALAWSLRALTWALMAWSWRRMCAAVIPRPWYGVLAAPLFLFLVQHFNLAGEWVIGGIEAKGFAFVFVFLALEAAVIGRWNRAWILLGIASAFHVLVGGWAAVALGFSWLLLRIRPPKTADAEPLPSIRSMLPALAIALIVSLAGLVPSLRLDVGVPATVARRAHEIYVYERFDHHLDPTRFVSDGTIGPFAVMTVAWLAFGLTFRGDAGMRRFRGFVLGAILIAIVGMLIRLAGYQNRNAVAGLLRLYWFRLADFAVPLGLTLAGLRWAALTRRKVLVGVLACVALFHLADCAVLRYFASPPFAERAVDGVAWRSAALWMAGAPERPIFPRQPRADRLRDYGDWRDICRQIAASDKIPSSACFLIPRAAQTFKWYTGRGEVGDWKETPQDAASLVEWWNRMQEIYARPNPTPLDRYYGNLAEAGTGHIVAMAHKYHADYLLAHASFLPVDLPIVCSNTSWIVYRIPPLKTEN